MMVATPPPAELVQRLLSARAAGDHFPEWMAGALDLDTALGLQLAILDHEGVDVGGWKVGLTSEASRTMLGADERPFGFVRQARTLDAPASIDPAAVSTLSIETEMCFTIASDVTDPTIAPTDILGHVASVHAGFELNEARTGSARPDFFAMVTDCLTNWGIVCGQGLPPTDAASLSACEITMRCDGDEVFRGVSSDHVDDHTISLCRLVEQLARHGRRLEAGQRVITGAFARFPTEPGQHWQASFSGIGDVEIQIQGEAQ